MVCFSYLGSEIARLRNARGMTPKNLAQLIDDHEVTILNPEVGKSIGTDLLEMILTSLGLCLTVITDNGNKLQK